MDRLTSMEIFARVAEADSFSAVARRLGLSKSAVSKHVMALENRLGARLLNRTTRRLSLTEAGAAYHERCMRIVADVEEAELLVTRLHSDPRGRLKVNAPMSFGQIHLAPAIPDFLALYPHVRVEMTLNDRIVELIDEGFDLAVRIGRLEDSSLIARLIARSPGVVCGAPGYFRRHGVPATPGDLSRHNCLIYSYASSGDTWQFTGPDGDESVRVNGNFWANNGDALRAAALRGLGVLMAPRFIVGEDLRSRALEAVLGDYGTLDPSIYAVYPHNRHVSAKLRVFVDFLVKRFGSNSHWNTPDAIDKPA